MATARASRVPRLAAFIVAAFCTLGATKPPQSPPPSEKDLKELRGRIEKLQSELTAKEESRGEAADLLKATGKAVSEARRALFDLAQRRRAIESELAAIAGKERATREGVAQQETLAAKLLRLQYQQGAPDRLRLMLEGQDAATVARQLAYYGYIQRARAELIGELRGREDTLAGLAREAAERRDELRQNERDQAVEARKLEKEKAAQAAVVAHLAGDIAKNRREIGRLKKDEARLTRLVEEIAKTLAAKPAPGEQAKGRRVERVADASLASKPFESLKGLLSYPVKGELTNRYGSPREETGATWKGLFIRAVSGETVHAIADGRVVYADWLRGFGNLLILDHGRGFMSLYANNEALLRQVGETVRSGDAIANTGASDFAPESGLYFELRRDGKPFDPLAWVAP
ncbi:MAG: peptidoglycan DD-metalloendopeptidase family protein [Usitatibacter sp.]